ncbi:hypothetical protein LTR36_001506 [Oleoguttula mirabilis]|uniref:GATA-type domain-containing protein n=1 Tax=Oleoguttula mirabilis TaxID=1507867 RepID=A0AAV9JN16_9PEZI|nr:hypothetical protein LTR36_001506 [Oleoguttula mirabilis]
MDAANRRPQLPALSYLDIDKVKREEEAYRDRNIGTVQSSPAVTAASPTYPYPTGPPPPYSQPPLPPSHHANAWPGAQSGVHIPPESRRTSGEEQEAKQTTRQSLPSISEALGVDSQTSYSASTTAAPPPVTTHQPYSQPVAPASPTSATARSYGMEPPAARQSMYTSNNAYQSFPQYRPEPLPQHSFSPHDPPRPAYAPDIPPPQVQTSHGTQASQQASGYTYPTRTSPHYEQPPSHTTGAMGPPTLPYGYTPYPPRYAQPTPPSSTTGGPIYQPSLTYPAPPAPPAPSATWKSEGSSKYGEDLTSAPAEYSSSVKRHLDMYDVEGAVTEIAQTSSIMMDFTGRYGDRLHQTARSGPTLSSLPGLIEIDDMISKSRMQVDSLLKIREVILAQQAAYDQHLADQRQQNKAFTEPPTPADDLEGDDSKGGFAGSDTKKRRGRAAPPGRCHSCNRAETPEWRRGPDGARTLCNACGLHYAKLTRKQQGANKATSAGSSTLRPKET